MTPTRPGPLTSIERLVLALVLLALPAGGLAEDRLGKPGDPAKVDRAIEIAVSDDMRFSPDEVRIKTGQTIRFHVVNGSALDHMMVLGRLADLRKQAALMSKATGRSLSAPTAILVGPGQTGNLIWQFTHSGSFDFACLIPGHLTGGMKGKVIVRP
jgi:uncharacterized cupredoxin-like copper-binding protein